MREALNLPHLACWRIGAWGGAIALLLAPLVAMQFTSAVNWGLEDFAAAALLLGGAGLAFELAVRLTRSTGAMVVAGLSIIAVVALTWAQLAVGLI